MATTRLPADFKEFLRSLAEHEVEYLLVGGYAVGYHGYPRATMDIDVWVARSPENAARIVAALESFGFAGEALSPELFLEEQRIVRMGLPPMRIEILTDIDGVEFSGAYADRVQDQLDGLKRSAGRPQDLADVAALEALHRADGDG